MRERALYVLLSFLFVLNGCSSQAELNELAVIVGLGIDLIKEDGKPMYQVTFQVIDPNQVGSPQNGGGSGIQIVNVSAKGRSLISAVRESARNLSRRNFYAHASILLIGEEAARFGLEEIMDLVERDQSIRTNIPMVIAQHTTALRILNGLTALNKIPAQSVIGKLENTAEILGENSKLLVHDFVSTVSMPGRNPVVSGIAAKGKASQTSKQAYVEQSHPHASNVGGLGIFDNQAKLIGWLHHTDARAVLLADNRVRFSAVSVPCGKKRGIHTEIGHAKAKKHVDMKQGRPEFHLDLYVEAEIEGIGCRSFEVASPKAVRQLEQQVSRQLEKEMQHGFQTVQKMQSDVFGFGEWLYRNQPRVWKKYDQDWPRLFGQADLTVKVQTTIRRSGMIQNHYPLIQ
ncbi:Ger(x)C family spore germination protein [Ectobacillus ponti]|uniref:Ger(X)C family spore germination protein n=1 Tax=Ectobacillus ponti TaxID=2961894 RepID=A0AA41XAF5_9BACI|nr:Ger(x)C family spore germination protein [Ectobacillus ponti]MCP8969233.1 Ger(x)C family spore germination protein [Ectobacillus ponti]